MTEKMALYARGIRINKERSNIEEFVLAAISAASGGYAGSSSMKVDKDLPEIDVDPDLLLEALACIIENACEAAPSAGGEIEIGISMEDVRSLASSPGDGLADGDYVRITVLDNGPGFNPEDSGKIFEPYYTTKKGSDGVGLALAYSILKRHRGFITASLPADGGALFSVYLPLF